MNYDKLTELKLTVTDKHILDNKIFSRYNELSFFSKKTTLRSLRKFNYYETTEGSEIYYLNHYFSHGCFFIDKDKKIIFGSRFYHFDEELNKHLPNINSILSQITQSDLNESVFIKEDVLAIQKWHACYGHIADEMFSLSLFKNFLLTHNRKYKCLLDYMTDNEASKTYPVSPNYKLIDKYLFRNASINAYDYKKKILRMSRVLIARNYFGDSIFHSFPMRSRNIILDNINTNFNLIGKRLYISRGKCLHLPRNLDNEPEILNYVLENGYKEINPENVSLDEFVCNVNAANKIIITWGSALTNLVYCKENTQVIILKSKSYEREDISLFQQIINRYNLKVKIISHENNKIIIPFL